MPGLVPPVRLKSLRPGEGSGIHSLPRLRRRGWPGQPGHDEQRMCSYAFTVGFIAKAVLAAASLKVA
ncbi:hypothetical protein [Bradyrhizobium sp. RT6a]|uniref:hypothetical protein n=1 Tax=unclassified Bradyrhizobium TaxID=2631580 RepID=UPI00339967D2